MTGAPVDESVENLRRFIASLLAAIGKMTRDAASLKEGLASFELARQACEAISDPEQEGSLPAALTGIDEALEDEVETAVGACGAVGTVVDRKEETELAAASKDVDAEADAFEAYADAAAVRVHEAITDLRNGSIALTHEANEAVAAMDRLQTQAKAAFDDVRKEAEDIVSVLATAVESSARVTVKQASILEERSIQPVEEAGKDFTTAIESAVSTVTASHGEQQQVVARLYPTLEQEADGTVGLVRAKLLEVLEAQTGRLESCAAALGTGSHQKVDEALGSLTGELESWATDVADAGIFVEGVPTLVGQLRDAHAIKTRVVGVLDVL